MPVCNAQNLCSLGLTSATSWAQSARGTQIGLFFGAHLARFDFLLPARWEKGKIPQKARRKGLKGLLPGRKWGDGWGTPKLPGQAHSKYQQAANRSPAPEVRSQTSN